MMACRAPKGEEWTRLMHANYGLHHFFPRDLHCSRGGRPRSDLGFTSVGEPLSRLSPVIH